MPRILLLNPPIYDFCAYDSWLKPLGLLRVAGMLRGRASMELFDFLDRCDSRMAQGGTLKRDRWGRGTYRKEPMPHPLALKDIPRRYYRFGLPRAAFREHLASREPYDVALVQTSMTYWYPGVRETIEDLRLRSPRTRVVLGGVYATLCREHAAGLGADLVVAGNDLEPLWRLLGLSPGREEPVYWEAYAALYAGALKLTDGCPFRCTYCASDRLHGGFVPRDTALVLSELRTLAERGVEDVAFYDDALLYRADETLLPMLDQVLKHGWRIRFHTPNALHARFITAELARRMVQAGFHSFYLGLESASAHWQERTGRKVTTAEFLRAVAYLREAGAAGIHAYVLLGHPQSDPESVEAALNLAHENGVRPALADFSPLPGTADGDACAGLTDLTEPLNHNKTAFPIRAWGGGAVNRLKGQCRTANRTGRALDRQGAKDARNGNDCDRQGAKDARNGNDCDRQGAKDARNGNDCDRQGAKDARNGNDCDRQDAKDARNGNDCDRQGAKDARNGNDCDRQGAKDARNGNDCDRQGAKDARNGNDCDRQDAKDARNGNDCDRQGAKDARNGNDCDRQGAKDARNGNGCDRQGAKDARNGNDCDRQGAKDARNGNDCDRQDAKDAI